MSPLLFNTNSAWNHLDNGPPLAERAPPPPCFANLKLGPLLEQLCTRRVVSRACQSAGEGR